jgi:hypothetical protein
MRFLILLAALTLGCAAPHKPCFTTLELSVFGSGSDGTSRGDANRHGPRDSWDNDDVTIGGSATMTFDFTGYCEQE